MLNLVVATAEVACSRSRAAGIEVYPGMFALGEPGDIRSQRTLMATFAGMRGTSSIITARHPAAASTATEKTGIGIRRGAP